MKNPVRKSWERGDRQVDPRALQNTATFLKVIVKATGNVVVSIAKLVVGKEREQ